MILRKILLPFLAIGVSTAFAEEGPKFRLTAGMESCSNADGATSGADLTNCLYTLSQKISKKMTGDVLCSGETCLVRLKISKDGNHYSAKGYEITVKNIETGQTYAIKFPSGKVAHYSICGTCHAVEPDDEKQIPLEMLFFDGGVLLEIPKIESAAK